MKKNDARLPPNHYSPSTASRLRLGVSEGIQLGPQEPYRLTKSLFVGFPSSAKAGVRHMESKDLIALYRKYLADDPNLARIMEQLGIDQEEYLKSMQVIDSSVIVSKRLLSNSTASQ
jgi:hypothetical protein